MVAVALVWACVLYTWRWFAAHADNLLARALRWTRAHPHLGRYAAALIDPNRPESPSLVMLAVCLLAISWAWFTLLASLLASGGPLAIDHRVHDFMWNLRNPLADRLMAALAGLGDAAVLGPAAAVALAYLLWRQALDGRGALGGGAGVRPGADLAAGTGDRHAAPADRAGGFRLPVGRGDDDARSCSASSPC